MSDLYKTLKELCSKKGISAYKMCKDCGIQPSIMTDLKMGRRSSVKIETALKLANYFNVSVGDLLGKSENTDIKKAPVSKRDEREEEFVEMFKHLNPEQQDLVIAQLKGILDTHKK